MEMYYTSEKNTQMLLALMKAHGIRKVVASPGTTNICFVASAQQDPFFEIYSSVDERSAAYIACGMAAESGEPVVLSCTGATASRNYAPGLTEAFYSKLPILVVTSTQHLGRVGQLVPQVIDRSNPMKDIAVYHADIQTINTADDEWDCNVKLNTAILALKWRGGGPVHINLTTTYSDDFSIQSLPKTRVIRRIASDDELPKLDRSGHIAIFVGLHQIWSEALVQAVDTFCERYNAVVLCDCTSNYKGKYGVFPNLITNQSGEGKFRQIKTLIHIGNVSGAYISLAPEKVWRINPDGEIRDTYKKLEYVFEMNEITFFEKYIAQVDAEYKNLEYFQTWHNEYNHLLRMIPELPFSNIWIANQLQKKLPENSSVYLGILNTLRSWNFFALPKSILCFSNTGGFGIDGTMSSALGVTLCDENKLCYAMLGDLAFFYDMNVLGNRHVKNNLRIMVINNGVGTEFKNYSHRASGLGERADDFVAARGHFGAQSERLVKDYAANLGYEYLVAHNKSEFLAQAGRFVDPNITDKPIIFEVFTNSEDESNALHIINSLNPDPHEKNNVKEIAKKVLGGNGTKIVKQIIRNTKS